MQLTRKAVADRLGIEPEKVRVLAGDIGGSFGLKIGASREELAVAAASYSLGQPVKWIEDRSENLTASGQAREESFDVRVAVTNDGDLLGLDVSMVIDTGRVVYGPPGGLAGKSLPQPTQSAGVPALVEGDSAPADGGIADDAPSSSGDASPCPVSWAGQIFVDMTTNGRWKCGDSACHGGLQSPRVTGDAKSTYASFAAFTMTPPAAPLPFVLPGSTSPGQSGFECSLSSGSCGPEMPLTQAGAQPLTKTDVAIIDQWVRCGAPDN